MTDSAGRMDVMLGVARPSDIVDPLIDLAGAAIQHILRALEQLGGVRLTKPERATEGDLRSALSTSRPNVFHFIGHCRSRATGYGTLVIEDSSGKSRSVSAHYMSDILTTAPTLRIVLLQTTREMDLHVDEFAKNFLDRGVHAVVVVQHLDATAGAAFARAFYTALCNGRLVNNAVAAGSQQLKETAGPSPDDCVRLYTSRSLDAAHDAVSPARGSASKEQLLLKDSIASFVGVAEPAASAPIAAAAPAGRTSHGGPPMSSAHGFDASNDRLNVFVSYSHRDMAWLERVQVHLRPLARDGKLDLWDDTRIRIGQRWREEIKAALAQADVAVLLISADFYASDFIANNELPPLLELARSERGLVIAGVHINYSRFDRDGVLSEYQTVNTPDRPIEDLSKANQEKVFDALARRIEEPLVRLDAGRVEIAGIGGARVGLTAEH